MNPTLEDFLKLFWLCLAASVFFGVLTYILVWRRSAWLRFMDAEESFWARFGLRKGGWRRRFGESRFCTIYFVVITAAFLLLTLLSAASYYRFKPLLNGSGAVFSDADLRTNLIGTWTHEGVGGAASFAEDGRFSSAWTNLHSQPPKAWTYGGRWGITNGICLITNTEKGSWNATNSLPIGSVDRWKIIRLDNSNLIWELDGQRVSLRRSM